MNDAAGLSDQYPTASPWPVFVALGLPIAEIGILFGLFPVAVGGLLLFCGSIAGIVEEAGYSTTPWRPLATLAVVLVALGGVLAFTEVSLVTRGYAIIVAGAILLLGGVVGELFVGTEAKPL